MKAYKKTYTLLERLERRGINSSFEQANTLRRAELTLQRWAELECGDGNDYQSWSLERDEHDKPFMCYYPHDSNKVRRIPTPDKEKGALKRIAAVCNELNIHFYHQTDPRGCSLYVSREPISGNDYTNGVNCNG
jgi:hypothetical protein